MVGGADERGVRALSPVIPGIVHEPPVNKNFMAPKHWGAAKRSLKGLKNPTKNRNIAVFQISSVKSLQSGFGTNCILIWSIYNVI